MNLLNGTFGTGAAPARPALLAEVPALPAGAPPAAGLPFPAALAEAPAVPDPAPAAGLGPLPAQPDPESTGGALPEVHATVATQAVSSEQSEERYDGRVGTALIG